MKSPSLQKPSCGDSISNSARLAFNPGLISSILLLLLVFLAVRSDAIASGGTAPIKWSECLKQSPSWYASDDAVRIALNVLQHQRESGGWPKGIDMTRALTPGVRSASGKKSIEDQATIDNGATTTQIRFLAKVFNATRDTVARRGFENGVAYLLNAQYRNGGWPQYYPLAGGYHDRITFNDNAMVNVLDLLMDISEGKGEMAFTAASLRSRAASSVRKGVECILACQVRVNGELTAWCAQHDEASLQPASARAFESVSLSGSESVGIVRFLMRQPEPDARIIEAVQGAVSWLDRVRLKRISLATDDNPSLRGGQNEVMKAAEDALPLWARFYDIDSSLPFVADRDTVRRYAIADLSAERRNGYGWFGDWPQNLLTRNYPKWQRRWAKTDDVLSAARRGTRPGSGKRVALDMYFNNEWRERKDGTRERYHYTWDDTTNSGFSQLGAIIDSLGARRSAFTWSPTLETLAACDVYIIVDPDLPKESPDPHFMELAAAEIIREWVRVGGVLVLMTNDSGNAEMEQFNTLSREFGIRFNEDRHHPVVGKAYETGATSPLPPHDAFKGVRKIFTKEVSSLTLTPPAAAILTEGEIPLMAESRFGKGLVFAVGDPWLYNEYMDHRRLPADFENDRAAEALFHWLLTSAR
jgi:PelA/Pel-15E family pectate lyase